MKGRPEVAVVGAGSAGLYAALTAAREGARTILVAQAALATTASYWAQGARALLLELYARALAAASGSEDVAVGGATASLGSLTVTARREPGAVTTVRSPAGVLQLLDVRLELVDDAATQQEATA